MNEFSRNGGVIQAAPSQLSKKLGSPGITFLIEPNGEVKIISTYEKINAYPFMTCGYMSPQKCLPSLNSEVLIEVLAQKLYQKGVFGYIHLDIISFPDPFDKKVHPLFWMNDLKVCYNDFNSIHEVTNMIAMTKKKDTHVMDYNIERKTIISLPF